MFNIDKEEEMTHIYVSRTFANKYKELTEVNAEKEIAFDVIESKKINIKSELSQLDDDVVSFKAACIAHKKALGDVYEEQSDKLDTLINECWEVMPKAKANAQKMADEIAPFKNQLSEIKNEIEQIKELTQGINFYGAESVIKLASQINSMDSSTKDILTFLVNNFKTNQ